MSKRNRRSSLHRHIHPIAGDPELEGTDHRQVRLEHVLFDELQTLIRDEASDPSLEGVTLLAVHLSPDGGQARIPYVLEGGLEEEPKRSAETAVALTRATGFLRARLAQQLDLKRLPKLGFTFIGMTGGAP